MSQRDLIFTASAWAEYQTWQTQDQKVVRKINRLIQDISRTPFQGLGKPEGLKGSLAGFWSRRIDREHRLVYRVDDGEIVVISCRYHN